MRREDGRAAYVASHVLQALKPVLEAELTRLIAEAGPDGYIAYAVNLRPVSADAVAERVMPGAGTGA